MLQVKFADVDRDIATTLSKNLRRQLIEHGGEADSLSLVRNDPNDMDLGSILQITSSIDILTTLEKGLTVATIVHCLYELVHRESVTIIVKGPAKEVRLPPTAGHEDIQKAVLEVSPPDDESAH